MRVINSMACSRFGSANTRRWADRSESQTSGSPPETVSGEDQKFTLVVDPRCRRTGNDVLCEHFRKRVG